MRVLFKITKLVSKENREYKLGNYDLTYGNFNNTFTGKSGDMETLDYIFSRLPIFYTHPSSVTKHMFRVCSQRCRIRCVETRLPLPHVISASLPFSYSDHEAVETSLIVEINSAVQRKSLPEKLGLETLRKVRAVLHGELFKTEAHQRGKHLQAFGSICPMENEPERVPRESGES